MLDGPHAAPDFFTDEDIAKLYATAWQRAPQLSRTGVRLIGPKPRWARPDGGEAGLHPSNIHDNAYAVGTVDFTGDMPIILGPDGPSLGGFVCPATIIEAELWKMGQLKAGDTVRFVPVSLVEARRRLQAQERGDRVAARRTRRRRSRGAQPRTSPLLATRPESRRERPAVVIRQDGDANLLVEYGPRGAGPGAALPRARADAGGRRAPAARRRRRRRRASGRCRSTTTIAALPREQLLAALEDDRGGAARHRRHRGRRRASSTCRCRGTIRRRGSRSASTCSRCGRTRPGARATSSSSAASTGSPASTTSSASSSTPATWCSAWATSTWARRWPRRSTRATGW